MRSLLVVLLVAALAGPVAAHTFSEHGFVNTATFGLSDVIGPLELVESIAPGTVPSGLLYYVVHAVQGGDTYAVLPDDGQEPFVIGLADECPGPRPPAGYDNGTPLENTFLDPLADTVVFWTDDANNMWLYCHNAPDYSVWFDCADASYPSSGTVPCDGAAYVFLDFGDAGEGFTYAESP